MGHDPGPNSACTKGQQVHAEATSYATTWIQGTTTALPIGSTTTAEGKTDIAIGTTRTECIGITGIEFSWTTTATTTGGTQACGKANAEA